MGRFFVHIYEFFSRNKLLMWTLLITSTILMTLAAFNVRYVEDITNFFPKQQQNISLIYDNLPAKDKLVVMFSCEEPDADRLISAAERFAVEINKQETFQKNATLSLGVNDSIIESMSGFIYHYLPLLIEEEDFGKLDSLVSKEFIKEKMQRNYDNLLSPIGGYISDYIYKDPLSLGSRALSQLRNLGNNIHYSIIDNYVFSQDEKTLICYITPKSKLSSGDSKRLVEEIESSVGAVNGTDPGIKAEYFGAAAVAAYNAKQIKTDSMVTLNIAMLIVILFITLAFKNKYSVLLVLTPVIYGALFALSVIYLVSGEISLIAVGSGSVIFGIALSYSIHIMAHTNHSRSMKQLIEDLAYPLTIGSFTTIGAFAGLLFTNSKLLQDFGLFSSLTLVGTTLFALIFLPHFLTVKGESGSESKLLSFVDRVSNMRMDKNKPLVWTILLLTLVLGIFFGNVGFDSNMMNLNYEPVHLKAAEKRLNNFTGAADSASTTFFIASGEHREEAIANYKRMCGLLDSLKACGKISSFSSINSFIVSDSLQTVRLDRWNKFWRQHHADEIYNQINAEAVKLGFEDGAYSGFNDLISVDYKKIEYGKGSMVNGLFSDWVSSNESMTTFIAQVKLSGSDKPEVYNLISAQDGIIVADRAFFAGKMAEDVSSNFYLILYLSGVLIFLALILSYGRIELTLISFLPMFISWIIILGVMSLLGIEFNIVTIILSTFIFGIGDDFSIFIMDGLLSEYTDKTRVLAQHKTAIFFSAFTIVVGMGALIFAKHPAMHSLGLISLVGIVVVVLVAYTIQPFVFRVFISSQTEKGGFPFTMMSFLNTVYAFGLFVSGCIVIQFMILASHLVVIGKKRRKEFIHRITSWSTHAFLRAMVTTKMVNLNNVGETFEKPAVIIANHQSFIDILLLLGLHRKLVMVTNGWVWRSPFYGKIVRYLDFYHTEDGYEALTESLKEKIKDGYSVIIFPEGTRSPDCEIKRFHKGAFYLAEKLQLDLLPVLIYGNGLISSKRQPFYIKKGLLVSKILSRIPCESKAYGNGYKERTKQINEFFRIEYGRLYEEYNRIRNPYFKDALIKNYIYKGPVLEWYMRIKLRLENCYDGYDRLLPRDGYIVDLGCGYGAMSYMLSMLSCKRRVTGVDYDLKKISLANNCFAKTDAIEFIQADIRTYDIPSADGYVISDVLHYIDYESQKAIIEKCIDRLNRGGVLIIRDGDTSVKERHSRTEVTEKWSTRIVKFNKTDGPLCFLSRDTIYDIARHKSMMVEIVESDSVTSNTLFILTHKQVSYE